MGSICPCCSILCGHADCKNKAAEKSLYCDNCFALYVKCRLCLKTRMADKPYCVEHCAYRCNAAGCDNPLMDQAVQYIKNKTFAEAFKLDTTLAYCSVHRKEKFCPVAKCGGRKKAGEKLCEYHGMKQIAGRLMSCNIAGCPKDAATGCCADHTVDMLRFNKIKFTHGATHLVWTKSNLAGVSVTGGGPQYQYLNELTVNHTISVETKTKAKS